VTRLPFASSALVDSVPWSRASGHVRLGFHMMARNDILGIPGRDAPYHHARNARGRGDESPIATALRSWRVRTDDRDRRGELALTTVGFPRHHAASRQSAVDPPARCGGGRVGRHAASGPHLTARLAVPAAGRSGGYAPCRVREVEYSSAMCRPGPHGGAQRHEIHTPGCIVATESTPPPHAAVPY